MNRRQAIQTALLSTAAFAVALRRTSAQNMPLPAPALTPPMPPAATGPFVLPPLPYAFDALEPHIDALTMQTHHDKHHATYVKNLNAAVAKLNITGNLGPADGSVLIANLLTKPSFGITDQTDPTFKAIRNNGGGHYNHSLFWPLMKKGGGGKPTGDLTAALDKQFGSYTQFQSAFTAAALGQFGSGWAWLSASPDGTMKIESTPNQDSPLMYGRTPILGIDVWEHAYYLKYQNRRADYIAAWYNTIDWDFVNSRFAQAKKSA